jgi:hypothetical protein
MGLNNANDWPDLIQTIKDHVEDAKAKGWQPSMLPAEENEENDK